MEARDARSGRSQRASALSPSSGLATALTAHVSRQMLACGRRFCFLYTDMSNPTSNAIYQRIGYELTCRSVMISFADA